MKKKNAITVALLLCSAFTFAQHQDHQGHGRKLSDHADHLKKELALDDNQYAQVKKIDETFVPRYAAIRQDTSLTRGNSMKKMEAIRTEQEAELKKILTPDQWSKWTAQKAARADDRKNPHPKKSSTPK